MDILTGESVPTNQQSQQQTSQPLDVSQVFTDLHTILQQRHASPRAFELLQAAHNAVQSPPIPPITTSGPRTGTVRRIEDTLQNTVQTIAILQQRLSQVEAHNVQNTNMNNATSAASANEITLKKLVAKNTPPRFSGKSYKLTNWLFEVKQFLDLAGFVDSNAKARYVVSLLEGEALTWWRMFSQTQTGDLDLLEFEDLEQYMLVQFEDVDRELKLRRKLQSLKQITGVQQYANEFRRVQLELGDKRLDDSAAMFQFQEGLKDAVRQQVLLQRPETLEETMLLAERADAAIMFNRVGKHGSDKRPQYNNNRNSRFHNNKQQSRGNGYKGYGRGPAPMDLDTMQKTGTGGSDSRGSNGRGGHSKITCYYCGKPGHTKKQCFKMQRDQQQQGSYQKQQRVNMMEYPPPPTVENDDASSGKN